MTERWDRRHQRLGIGVRRTIEDCCGATDKSNHDHAIKMIKMQGGVFGAVSNSAAFIEVIE